MRAVMYHYVREHDPALPNQRYLHVDDFVSQLDWLEREFGFLTRERFDEAVRTGRAAGGVVLTFDDALTDHAEVVMPILRDRGLWGMFFVPTRPYRDGRLLDVHRVHLLTGRFDGAELIEALTPLVDESMLVHARVAEFRTLTYGRPDDDDLTDRFKRTINYFIDDDHRRAVLDGVVQSLGIDERAVARRYYVRPETLAEMHREGMVVGSHSDAHVVLSTLDPLAQRSDLATSVSTLSTLIGAPVEAYCHPFGGFHTFDRHTESTLTELGIRYAFNVEPRTVSDDDLRDRPMTLPRFDCNQFPHGRARIGARRPEGAT